MVFMEYHLSASEQAFSWLVSHYKLFFMQGKNNTIIQKKPWGLEIHLEQKIFLFQMCLILHEHPDCCLI